MLYQAIHVPDGHAPISRDVLHLPELARYLRGWGREGDCGFLAAVGQPVGAVWLRLLVGEERGYGYVAEDTPELSIALLPEFRGRGIGTQLLTRLFASPCGDSPISLSVSADDPAVRLYRRLGFEVVGESGGSLTMVRDRGR
ncbi:MAG: GNAT family N-acetyltransferase [Spirochaetaceae bacterium]|nr:MAG: GNAT family N-acetyltransferase [Spirochaetaceae bacterium]